jgi:hypothetical protein
VELNMISRKKEKKSKFSKDYNRKEKSLGELSKKFLFMFGRIEECVISLDSITQQLGSNSPLLSCPHLNH